MREGVSELVSSKHFSLSLLRCQEFTHNPITDSGGGTNSTGGAIDSQLTLERLEHKLREGREQANRPMELTKMSVAQLRDEKTALQKALLHYENLHGRPNVKSTRELARPLYDRYRIVKRMVSKSQVVSGLPSISESIHVSRKQLESIGSLLLFKFVQLFGCENHVHLQIN